MTALPLDQIKATGKQPMSPHCPGEIDNTWNDPRRRAPLVVGDSASFHAITEKICYVAESPRPPKAWYIGFGVAFVFLNILGAMIGYLLFTGVGVWGMNRPNMWAFDITNFVFWVGIGHAGTLISAILFLFRQKWRTSINRAAEAMTIFAVMCALTFPGIHVGRVWVAYWMFPVPNQMGVWPNFRSPLLWDVFAVSVYGTVSVLFWYVGLIPDLATMRDRAKTRVRQAVYGFFALGWRGSVRNWNHYESAHLVLAALATPLVLSVHSVVSMDFAVSVLPGWHTTIFPPYFVAGAIFSGFAMVVTLMVICRTAFRLEHIITLRHFDYMAKIMLVTGSMVGYAYTTEFFTSWYSGDPYEFFTFMNRALGPYAWAYWIMITCNVISPQIFWIKKARTNIPYLFFASIIVNIGMWFERFVIIVTSLHRDFLPSAWGYFTPTIWDISCLLGSFGLFFTMFCLFVRFLPMVATAEVKTVLPQANPHGPVGYGTPGHELPTPMAAAAKVAWSLQLPLLPRLPKGPYYGTLAAFASPADLFHACERLRDAGFTKWDAHTPFPVHGLSGAMGLRRSELPWIVLVMALLGGTLGF